MVNQAKPRTTPSIRDKSKRGYFDKSKENKKEVNPKKDSKVSAKATRSKKKENGNKQ